MSPGFTESVVEEAALAWLEGLGYAVLHGPDDLTDRLTRRRFQHGARARSMMA